MNCGIIFLYDISFGIGYKIWGEMMQLNIKRLGIIAVLICLIFSVSSCGTENISEIYNTNNYDVPEFTESEITTVSFESYSELDDLGRCGTATACIGLDLMPTEERGAIGQVKPSGWQISKYDFIDGKYLFNRCHLIGYQLSGENANERNLITGTRYMNAEGMLPLENEVADYVKETGNHVMYRVTPVFEGDNLVASGVRVEAYSVEDDGKGVCFNVFVANVQPGVVIDYSDGSNWEENDDKPESKQSENKKETGENAENLVLNTNTKKYHRPDCVSVKEIKESNKETYNGTKQWLSDNGYSPCGVCKP